MRFLREMRPPSAPSPGHASLCRRAPPPGYAAAALILLPAPRGTPSTIPAAAYSSYLLPAMSAAPSKCSTVARRARQDLLPDLLHRRSPACYASLRRRLPPRSCCASSARAAADADGGEMQP
ncbi:hypothetical protein ACQJBY_065249 [Aegilops geniculata]